ncbi:DUF4263 domain-containing protein [Leptospira sp. 2 VSF19]|uniref:DUF4263 domain-containing protein n=1 Tax=Leptospira soteropolitanensis TaxID=2950025 RepID=A0AAW5VTM1_9LEPT|nr:Shedu anti-phage system protein SduA domain-containing protein [Leptospira soteropolitanensis]MCW7494690.1 DUF4263 domain-containing protein [Leptospira soteropolitanensis]MCW7502295.1 DUF4263 domain-containing protein [Leptospira soteropolitanensis]MCW7524519.1 DUF4263 domain-containing protein [Leptospira soteropolitanensis]MCW7528395.1 DUF4263 domain-containing protein [Leptospira soteropolitanensis]MCW7532247.1 DUF4263 domain-containing protein [Leptospira soteropolitanensis]
MKQINEDLIKDFESTLDNEPPKGKQKEQVVQDFLETNTEIFTPPNLLNHRLHFESIISKFPLDTSLITDFVYLTKSSGEWIITLVELESPNKKFFRSGISPIRCTSEFSGALDQIQSWQNFINKNKSQIINKLQPLMHPMKMRQNPISFQYWLIYGRSNEKNSSAEKLEYIKSIENKHKIIIYSFDSLITAYRNELYSYKKNILKLEKTYFKFKYLNTLPEHIFASMTSDELSLDQDQIDYLKKNGYEIDEWRNGELLTHNIFYTEKTRKKMIKRENYRDLDNGV